MQVFSTCWHGNEQLLRSEGLGEQALSQTWAALTSYIRESMAQGRGVNLSGMCKLLHSKAQANTAVGRARPAAAVRVVLSDKLLKKFPNLQLGSGISHFAAAKDQVQGADNISHVKLAQRCKGLNRDAVQLVLKLITATIVYLMEAQQSFSLDLGVGQLRFKGSRVVEFQPSSSISSPAGLAAADAGCNSSTGLTAETLSQLGGAGIGSACRSAVSRVSQVSRNTATSRATAAAAAGQLSSDLALRLAIGSKPVSTEAAFITSSSMRGNKQPGDLPDKPCSSPLSPDEIITASRQARAAARANARVKAATFVLPAGGPGDLEAPRVPQGKGKPAAADDLAHQKVLEAAAVLHERQAAAQAAAEERLLANNASLKQRLDEQAQAIMKQQAANKKKLAETLAQQVQEKQSSKQQEALGGGGALLLPPTAGRASTQRIKQQEEYRAALDEQLAFKASMQQRLKAQEAQTALIELQQVQQSVVAAAQAARSSRQATAAAVKQQLDTQVLRCRHKEAL